MTTERAAVSGLQFPRHSRAQTGRTVVRAGAALCGAVLLGLVFSYASLLQSGRLSIGQSDFLAYYAASKLIAHGLGSQIYAFGALSRVQAPLIAPVKLADGGLPYLYPPFFAVILTPIVALPLGAAFGLWLVLNCSLLIGSLLALQRYAQARREDAALFWLASLSFLPVFMALAQGQVSVLLLACLTGCLFTLRSGHDRLAGAILALTLLKPTYIFPFLLLLAIRRRWQGLVAFGVAAVCLLAFPVPFTGFSVNQSYLHILGQAASFHGHFGFEVRRNQTLAGLAGLLSGAASQYVTVVLDALALCLLLAGIVRSREVDLPFGLCVVVAILVNPHVFIHDLTMLILPVGIALRYRGVAGRQLHAVLVAGYAAALIGPRLMFTVPLQVCVLAMAALAISLFVIEERQRGVLPSTASTTV